MQWNLSHQTPNRDEATKIKQLANDSGFMGFKMSKFDFSLFCPPSFLARWGLWTFMSRAMNKHCPPSLWGLITSGLDFTGIQGRPCFYTKPSPQKLHKETKCSWNDTILWINPSWQLHPTHLIHQAQWDGGEKQRHKSEKAHGLR